MKKLYSFLAISLLVNAFTISHIHMNTPYFSDQLVWTEFSLNLKGVFTFNDRSLQPDPNSLVQHLTIKCMDKDCNGVDSNIMGNSCLVDPTEVKVLELNYAAKQATFEAMGCRITVADKSASFTCKDGKVGAIASHFPLIREHYGFFKGWF